MTPPRKSRAKLGYAERQAMIGEPPLWGPPQAAAFLGVSLETLSGLPIPRADIAGPKYVSEHVREWARLQVDRPLPATAA